jgi:hypothetical protein
MPKQLISTDEPLAEPTTKDEKEFVEALRDALHGELQRDTVPNTGLKFDDSAIMASRATFNAFLESNLFDELQSI